MGEHRYDQHREDIAGRANVGDTAELVEFYRTLESHHAGALWTVANKIEPWEPQTASAPMIWKYDDLRAHVMRALDLVTPEQAGRRVVYLANPGRRWPSGVAVDCSNADTSYAGWRSEGGISN